jgi:hypothetical protein
MEIILFLTYPQRSIKSMTEIASCSPSNATHAFRGVAHPVECRLIQELEYNIIYSKL